MKNIIEDLENEKHTLLKQVELLQKEIALLDKLIMKKKAEKAGEHTGEKINKKNINRLFFETLITESLKNTKHGLKTDEINKHLKSKGHIINNSTLRTYIMNMRNKGLIKKNYNQKWKLTECLNVKL